MWCSIYQFKIKSKIQNQDYSSSLEPIYFATYEKKNQNGKLTCDFVPVSSGKQRTLGPYPTQENWFEDSAVLLEDRLAIVLFKVLKSCLCMKFYHFYINIQIK